MMGRVMALASRELGAYFLHPLAYMVLCAIQLLAWMNFWQLLAQLDPRTVVLSGGMNDPMNAYIAASAYFWIAILFATPALTMRLVAEERRSGTMETLLTAPVTETQVILAKWLAGFVMYLALLLPYAIYLPFLHREFPFDLGPILSLGVGLATLGMMFVAIGVFFSSLTRNQVVAGIWTFAILFLLILLTSLGYASASERRSEWADVLLHTAILYQTAEFAAGRLDLRFLAIHLSMTGFMLFLAVKVLTASRGR